MTRFTVLPMLMAFIAGLLNMPAQAIVRVDARGFGHERLASWRARGASVRDAIRTAAGHPLAGPAVAAAVLGAAVLVDHRAILAAPIVFGMSLTENAHTAAFLLSEAESAGGRSREAITVLSGENLKAGHVVGRRLVSPTFAAAVADSGNTGDGTCNAPAAATNLGAQRGTYRAVCVEAVTNGGRFVVTDPSGIEIGVAVVGSAFDNQIKFTISDGATDFVAGDAFSFAVTGGTYKYQEYDPSNADGGQRVAGILYAAVDASAADTAGVIIARDAEVRDADLVWFSGATTTQKQTAEDALKALGIIARS